LQLLKEIRSRSRLAENPIDFSNQIVQDGCPAERVGWPLRGAGGGCAAARLEKGSKSSTSLGEKSIRGRKGPA